MNRMTMEEWKIYYTNHTIELAFCYLYSLREGHIQPSTTLDNTCKIVRGVIEDYARNTKLP